MMNLIKKAGIVAVTALTILGSSMAIAANGYITEYVYYSDSSKTTIVGESVSGCNGSFYVTGTITPYKKRTGNEPCGGFQ